MAVRRLMFASCLVLSVLAADCLSAEKNTLDEHLAPLAPFVGKTWRGEFKSSTKEKPLFDVSKWEVALKGKAIRMTAFRQ